MLKAAIAKYGKNQWCVLASCLGTLLLTNRLQGSYFLPSRQSGVNDMCGSSRFSEVVSVTDLNAFRYLHLGFRAPNRLVHRGRVGTVWTILRLRHPLLSASVEMHGYDHVRFV